MADKCTVIIKRQITPYKKGKRPEKMLEKKKIYEWLIYPWKRVLNIINHQEKRN